ncbi:hypothetical protein [Flindersiella endophytica]
MPLTVGTSSFEAGLVSWQSLAALEPLGHAVSPDAPSGSVGGLARPAAVQRALDMPVRSAGGKRTRGLGSKAVPGEPFAATGTMTSGAASGGLAAGSGPVVSRMAASTQPVADLPVAGLPAAESTVPEGIGSGPAASETAASEQATTEAASPPAEPATSGDPGSSTATVQRTTQPGTHQSSTPETVAGLIGETPLADSAGSATAPSQAAGANTVQRTVAGGTAAENVGLPLAAAPRLPDSTQPARTVSETAEAISVPAAEPGDDATASAASAPTTGLTSDGPSISRLAVQRSAAEPPVRPARPNLVSASAVELPVVTVQLHAASSPTRPTPAPADPVVTPAEPAGQEAPAVPTMPTIQTMPAAPETPAGTSETVESSSPQADPTDLTAPTLQPIQRAIDEPASVEPPKPRRFGLGEPMHVIPDSSTSPGSDPFELRPVLGTQPVVQRSLAPASPAVPTPAMSYTAEPAPAESHAAASFPAESAPAESYPADTSSAELSAVDTPPEDSRPLESHPASTLDVEAVALQRQTETSVAPLLGSAADLPIPAGEAATGVQPLLGWRALEPLSLQRSVSGGGSDGDSAHAVLPQTPGAGTMPASGVGTGPAFLAQQAPVQRSLTPPADPGSGRRLVRPAASNGGSAAPGVVQRFGLPGLPAAPAMPSLPSIPAMPSMPDAPSMPSMPALPSAPGVPSMPELPSPPGLPTLGNLPGLPGLPGLPSMPVTPAGVPSSLTDAATSTVSSALSPVSSLADSATAAAGDLADNVTNGVSSATSTANTAMNSVVAATGNATAEGLGPGGAPGPSGGGSNPLAAASPGDLDELSRQLYDRIRSRLRAELRLDRERAGLLTDPYR